MARRVFLHIGTMKSATTYLQQLCELNVDHLAASGVLWPPGDLRYQAVRDLFRREAAGVDFTRAWPTLARQIRRHPGDVVISNELLAAINTGHIRRLAKAVSPAEAHVIVTARDLARSMPSHWQTTIKNGRTHTWAEFAAAVCTDGPALDPDGPGGQPSEEGVADASAIHEWFWRRHDLLSLVARWQRYVPVDRISIVTVPPPGGDREDVARRFGSVIGVDMVGLTQPESWSNSSLGAHSAELLRRLNEQVVDVDRSERSIGYRGAVGGALAARAAEEPTFALSQAQQEWVAARAHKVNAELEGLGPSVVGDLADLLPAAAPPPGAVDPGAASDAELLAAASRGLMGMAETITGLTLIRRKVVAQLEALQKEHGKEQRTAARQRARIARLKSAGKGEPQATPSRRGELPSRLRRNRLAQLVRGRLRR